MVSRVQEFQNLQELADRWGPSVDAIAADIARGFRVDELLRCFDALGRIEDSSQESQPIAVVVLERSLGKSSDVHRRNLLAAIDSLRDDTAHPFRQRDAFRIIYRAEPTEENRQKLLLKVLDSRSSGRCEGGLGIVASRLDELWSAKREEQAVREFQLYAPYLFNLLSNGVLPAAHRPVTGVSAILESMAARCPEVLVQALADRVEKLLSVKSDTMQATEAYRHAAIATVVTERCFGLGFGKAVVTLAEDGMYPKFAVSTLDSLGRQGVIDILERAVDLNDHSDEEKRIELTSWLVKIGPVAIPWIVDWIETTSEDLLAKDAVVRSTTSVAAMYALAVSHLREFEAMGISKRESIEAKRLLIECGYAGRLIDFVGELQDQQLCYAIEHLGRLIAEYQR